jgi:hypothetical protein
MLKLFNVEINVYKLKICNQILLIFPALFLVTVTSCTSIRIGIELISSDFDGSALIKNEKEVKKTLETIILTPKNYTIAAYTRRVFSPEVERTKALYHSFYTLTGSDTSFLTLSFSGTKIRTKSKGVWAINTESDMKSFINYKNGINEWEVQEILINKGINTEMTIKNILNRMDKNITYYYKDHIKNREGMENCNTALLNTLVEND